MIHNYEKAIEDSEKRITKLEKDLALAEMSMDYYGGLEKPKKKIKKAEKIRDEAIRKANRVFERAMKVYWVEHEKALKIAGDKYRKKLDVKQK